MGYIRDADGQPVRPRINYRGELVFVRAFYEDIARWAADDPARWGAVGGAVPDQSRRVHAEEVQIAGEVPDGLSDQDATAAAARAPASAEQQHQDAAERISAARDTTAGDVFTAAGQEFQRCRLIS